MSKIRFGLSVFVILISVGTSLVYADKIGGSFSTEQITQDTGQNFKKLPSQTPAASSFPKTQVVQQTAITPAPAIEPITTSSISQSQDMSLNSFSQTKPLPKDPGIKKLNIKTTDYEEKFKEKMRAAQEKTLMRKKTFIESIMDEIAHFGLLFALLFVIVAVVYALKKEKPPQGAPPPEEKKEDIEAKPKTIWDDEF